MILTTHLLAGATIGKNIDNSWFVIPIAILAHFALDALPHGEYINSPKKKLSLKSKMQRIILDLSFGLILVFSLIHLKNLSTLEVKNILLGSFFSIFPDFMTVLKLKFNFKFLDKIHAFHHWVHYTSRKLKDNYWNFSNARNDILVSIAALLIFLI